MGFGQRFWRDERGTSFEGIALSVAIVAVAFVASADMLDYLTKPHRNMQAQQAASAPRPTATTASVAHDGNLDLMPTASLPALISRSVLNPCVGAKR